jgi:hypothetical protein
MMATKVMWPRCLLINFIKNLNLYLIENLPFSKARTKAVYRIGPHNIDVLSVLVCGMLGD